jgi:nucleoside triphosphate diphosphatase
VGHRGEITGSAAKTPCSLQPLQLWWPQSIHADELTMQPSRDISRLIEIMAALRDPDGGCPWDLEQDFRSIRHYTIEEAYEVADAIEREDFSDLREELGDLLLQPIYHAQMAKEGGHFDIGDVVFAITEKLIRRHPHVFGDVVADGAEDAQNRWEAIKVRERAAKAERKGDKAPSILDDVPQVLPSLARAEKLTKRAAKVGFDWPDLPAVRAKVAEELAEVAEAEASGNETALREEIGDLLFAVANLARKAGVDPEAALRDANAKFTRRFHFVEARCREDGVDPAKAGLDRLDGYWNEIRAADKG